MHRIQSRPRPQQVTTNYGTCSTTQQKTTHRPERGGETTLERCTKKAKRMCNKVYTQHNLVAATSVLLALTDRLGEEVGEGIHLYDATVGVRRLLHAGQHSGSHTLRDLRFARQQGRNTTDSRGTTKGSRGVDFEERPPTTKRDVHDRHLGIWGASVPLPSKPKATNTKPLECSSFSFFSTNAQL